MAETMVAVSTPSPDPEPMRKPPRGALTMRDMLVAIGVLVVVITVFAGLARACTFSPGGPTVDTSRLPTVDAQAELKALAPKVPFALRIPAVPAGWRCNSVSRDRVGDTGRESVNAGFVTPESRYVRLTQSDAAEEPLLGASAKGNALPAKGVEEAGGLRWVVYDNGRDEPIWIADTGATRLLLTGSGTPADFRAITAT